MSEASVRLAVDLVVLSVIDGRLKVLLVERGVEPFVGASALPGGFVLDGEDLPDAAVRELEEETGVAGMHRHLEQLRTYGTPGRDPRGRVIAVAYIAFVPTVGEVVAGSDAAAVDWVDVESLPGDLAFDHAEIINDGVERARAKLEYTSLGTQFCPAEFTINELRAVYEAVWNVEIDPRNFHRKVTGADAFVEPTGKTTGRGRGRPAQLFRVGDAALLHPPLLRGE